MSGPYQSQYPQQPQYPGQYPQQPQYPGQQQPYSQQQPPMGAGGGQGAIAVTTKFPWLNWILLVIKPKIFVNGHPVQGVWGRNVIPVSPGQHHLYVYAPYILPPKVGPAEFTVPVHPGQTVELEYRAPWWAFSSGSLGYPPQESKGLGLVIGIYVGMFVLFCLCCGLSLAAGG